MADEQAQQEGGDRLIPRAPSLRHKYIFNSPDADSFSFSAFDDTGKIEVPVVTKII